MRVIKDRKIVDDAWELLAPEAPLVPAQGDVIVSLALWNEAWSRARSAGSAAFAGRSGRVGLRLRSSEALEDITALEQAPLLRVQRRAADEEMVRERLLADVVQQPGGVHDRLLARAQARGLPPPPSHPEQP